MSKQSKFIKNISKPKFQSQPLPTLKLKLKDLPSFEKNQVLSLHKDMIGSLKVIGIYNKKVILTYSNQYKLFGYIDQHAMHERIRYQYFIQKYLVQLNLKKSIEKLSKFNQKGIQKQNKIIQMVLGKCIKVLIQVTQCLKNNWGLIFESVQGKNYLISYREILNHTLNTSQLLNIVLEISIDSNIIPKTIDKLIGQISCKKAVKFNDTITEQWCQVLLQNAIICDYPWYCVHGRPTIQFKT